MKEKKKNKMEKEEGLAAHEETNQQDVHANEEEDDDSGGSSLLSEFQALRRNILNKSQTTSTSYGPTKPELKMAVFMEKLDPTDSKWQKLRERVQDVFRVTQVTPEQLADGVLQKEGYDVLWIGGGLGSQHAKAIGPEGKRQIKAFLAVGGGYVGACAGAHLACAKEEGGGEWRFGLSAATVVDVQHWKRGMGSAKHLLSAAGTRLLLQQKEEKEEEKTEGGEEECWEYYYANGPLFGPAKEAKKEEWSEPIVLATFRTEFLCEGMQKGTMMDAAAIICGTYKQSGRLVLFSAHPELSSYDIKPHLRNSIRWAAAARSRPSSSTSENDSASFLL